MYRRDCLQARLDPVLNNILRSVTHSKFPCGGFIPQVILLLVAKHGLISLKLEKHYELGGRVVSLHGVMFPCLNQLLCLGARYASRFKPVRARQGLPPVLCIELTTWLMVKRLTFQR